MKSFTFPGPTSWLIVFVFAFFIISCNNNKTVTLEAGSLSLSFDKSGNLTAIKGLKGNDYLPKGEKAPLLTLRVKGKYEMGIPKKKTTISVKIIDMLGEEVLVTKEI